jgi:hypothetical protein
MEWSSPPRLGGFAQKADVNSQNSGGLDWGEMTDNAQNRNFVKNLFPEMGEGRPSCVVCLVSLRVSMKFPDNISG